MPRCKICKDKFEPKYFLQKTCFEPACILEYKNKVKAKEWKAEKKVLKEKLKTYSDHVKELQVIVNKYVRLRDTDNIHGQCVYCNQHRHGALLDYAERLPTRIGLCKFEELKKLRGKPIKYSIPELIEMKVIYKDKIKKL